ncbi:hypothetical protein [Paracoccus actinidiae]|uniref:hypothetical protein n=1 Tax=Paracoccus actinidiae TaxID=3064531 RepID=UPI0027D33DAB|nr:hypothetical protein [Paracoccus sp. M09]
MDHKSAAALGSAIAPASGSTTRSATGSATTPWNLQQENSILQARLAQLQAELSEKQQLLEKGQAEYRERIEDIVALTAHYRTRLEDASEQGKAQAAETSALKQQVQELVQQLDEVSRHRDSLLNSTSWKITAPLRAMIRILRGYRKDAVPDGDISSG